MFRLRQNVRILSSQKIDGRFNVGKIVGIKLQQNAYYLGYKNSKEFYDRFDGKNVLYTVAYIDCVTERACVDEFSQRELETTNKNRGG